MFWFILIVVVVGAVEKWITFYRVMPDERDPVYVVDIL
jgi:hypothetical protein